MDGFIDWCGFFGAWLVVAGSVFQAGLELHEESVARDAMERASQTVDRSAPVSPWWWLVPPVKYFLEKRRSAAFRNDVLSALSVDEVSALVRYIDKAAGWLLVGAGGTLIAAKESWELVEHYEWPTYLFWVLVIVAAWLCLANAGYRQYRSRKVLEARSTR